MPTLRGIVTAVAATICSLGLASPAVEATAAGTDELSSVVCAGSSDATYTPGVTYTPTTTTVHSTIDYSVCTVVNGGGITSALGEDVIITSTRSCVDLLSQRPSTTVLKWNNGTESTVDGTVQYVQTASALTVVRDGTVTSGPFTGLHMRREIQYAGVDAVAACNSPEGLTSLEDGIVALTLLPI